MERIDIESVNERPDIDKALLETSSHNTIAHHAKSFYWASKFLTKGVFKDVSFLYMFCRWVDDTADELGPDQAVAALTTIKSQLLGMAPPVGLMVPFLNLCLERGIKLEWVIELINGAESDLKTVQIKDEDELVKYSYRVAGVVGLMMCPLIGVKEPKAFFHAIDLGVAMQMVNIARDIDEDGRKGRIYIPETWLADLGIKPSRLLEVIQKGSKHERWFLDLKIRPLVKQLLDLSDRYTQSGINGLHYIPPRERLSILVAARIYQAIGKKIRTNQFSVLKGRAQVSALSKLWITARCAIEFVQLSLKARKATHQFTAKHQKELHLALHGLPAVNI